MPWPMYNYTSSSSSLNGVLDIKDGVNYVIIADTHTQIANYTQYNACLHPNIFYKTMKNISPAKTNHVIKWEKN